MSAGHQAADADVLDTSVATPEFIAQCAAVIAACTVIDSYDIPYLANRSIDGARVYRDRRVPGVLAKTGIDTKLSLVWHELPEWLAMNAGLSYLAAHKGVATPLERREVERQKPNDPNIWAAYSEEMDGFIRAVADETIEKVPGDLDLRPYEDENDRKVLAELMAAERIMTTAKPKRFFRAVAAPDLANSSGRIIRYRFSTPEVARDQHTISAWKLDNFQQNPVFLWAHAGREPPIGRVLEIDDNKGYLDGSVEYAERDVYPFADTVFQLVRGGYINAVSTSWDPLEWKFATDRSRPGGIDFKLVDLLELSQVPVPALPTALATARSAGIDTGPLYEWAEKVLDSGGMILIPRSELEELRREAKMPAAAKAKPQARAAEDWKVGASRNLPINTDMAWDGDAAAASIFEKAGFDGDKPDATFAKKGFLAYDASDPSKKGSYKLPFARVIDGRLTALASGIKAAASRLPQTDIPDSVREEARAVIDHYEGKMGKGKDDKEAERAARLAGFKRDLMHVAWLAYLLSDLDMIEDMVEWEAAIEEDDSPIPAQLAAVKKQLGEILVAMAGEEVAEMSAEEDAETSIDRAAKDCNAVGLRRAALVLLRKLENPVAIVAAMQHQAQGRVITITTEDPAAASRAGKVLSKKNADALREAHEHIDRGCGMIRGVLAEADGVSSDPDDDEDQERAVRRRKAGALKHKIALAS